MKHTTAIIIIIVFILLSCTELSPEEKKLRKIEAELLEFYKLPQDKLKREAALFLVDNLKYKYHHQSPDYSKIKDTILTHRNDTKKLEAILKSMKGRQYFQFKADLDTITSGYLIENIEYAFKAYERAGWNTKLSFPMFCEYVLPYRSGAEEISHWRKEIYNKIPDSVFCFNTIRNAGEYAIHRLTQHKKNFKVCGPNFSIPDMPYAILDTLPLGRCRELSHLTNFVLRAAAIPCAIDFTPHYANIDQGHNWNALILDSATSVPFIIPVKDTLGYFKAEHYTLAKVFRNTYSLNPQSHVMKRGYCDYLPPVLNNPFVLDVTEQYVPVGELEIAVEDSKFPDEEFAYLSVFGRRNWNTYIWGQIKDNTARFEKIAKNVVYLPQVINEHGKQDISAPFMFNGENQCHYFTPNHDSLITVNLLRKYPLYKRIQYYINRMVGGEFQGANRADFSDARLLYRIEKSPGEYFNDIEIESKQKFRFIRFVGPVDSYCNIAEFEIYEKGKPEKNIDGEIIATEGISTIRPKMTKEKAFDNNVLTYYQSTKQDSGFIGLDFGKPKDISKIRFIARSDFNIIVKGNTYELMYWENGWKSLGHKEATGQVLHYENVPSGAIYILHNHTEGQEERIFTYENGKQVWL